MTAFVPFALLLALLMVVMLSAVMVLPALILPVLVVRFYLTVSILLILLTSSCAWMLPWTPAGGMDWVSAFLIARSIVGRCGTRGLAVEDELAGE